MQYPIIDTFAQAYLNNGWTGIDIPETITYTPIQLGSGDPSPDNIRPILPATTLNIGGVDTPIYGGSLDVATGVLTVTHSSVDLGTLTWSYSTLYSEWYFFFTLINDKTNVWNNGFMSQYRLTSTKYDRHGDFVFNATPYVSDYAVNIRDSRYTNVTTFKQMLSDNKVQYVYELATPTTVQLTSQELGKALSLDKDISHRLKLPMQHYFPHPVIDALQRAAAGTQTASDTEILRHYLTPLGIGGI